MIILIFLIIYSLNIVSSSSIDSIYLNLLHKNLTNYTSLNNFYRNILQDVRNHRLIDTVQSPINVSKIRLNDYDEAYLKNSVGCFSKN